MNKSLWIQEEQKQKYNCLENEEDTDVCIIGAGLTGLTTAYYLCKEGKKVTVLEKDYIGSHTSGNTTGKITSQHGLFYKYLIQSVGMEQAKQYLEANESAITNIKNIINEEKIECDYEEQDSYVFTQKEDEVKKIKDEVEAVNKLGKNAEFVENINFHTNKTNCGKQDEEIINNDNEKINILKPILGAIKFPNQAQFNPYKYIQGLASAVEKNNGKIYEKSKVIKIEKNNMGYEVKTNSGKINAKYVVIASHYPMVNFPGFYFMKMYQEISYLIAVETEDTLFEGMYINSEEPTVSLRTALYGDKRIVLIGGMKHKTGAKMNLSKSYEKLEQVAKNLFTDYKVLYRWNSEDCISLDKIPYIGEFSELMPNVYVGTGYKKWGMTTSNVAGNIITDKIMGRKNKYEDVFNSKRLKPIKNYKELTNMAKEVGNSLIINKLKNVEEYTKDIKKEEGKIVEINGEKIGIYKDANEKIYMVKPVCTHLGCELSWNNLDKTWDCPCHGSRFNYDGKNIYDPAIKDLENN